MTVEELRACLPPARLCIIALVIAVVLAIGTYIISPDNLFVENRGFEAEQQFLLSVAVVLTLVALSRLLHPIVASMALATLAMSFALFVRETPNCQAVSDGWCVGEPTKFLVTAIVLAALIFWGLRFLPQLWAEKATIIRSLVWWPFPLLALLALFSEVAERSGSPLLEEGIELFACAFLATMAGQLAFGNKQHQ
ncbi:hypothetical protein [Ahrensia sp. R2A130]|uniref:hypothetical protein n=1 Tax=Ahrensia sp. R2A130 TaxID=744979 RepID=UPI0001E0AC78|nr:hypothetical protein [Ahrensia sp. R2A130]EFL90701.1 conserved domain protein [Ahrensia sp. R2A130]